jgi:hypothetical protein
MSQLKEQLTTQNVIIGLLTLAVIYLMYVNYNRDCDEKYGNIGTITTKFAADAAGEKYVTADADGNLSVGSKLLINNSGNVQTSTNFNNAGLRVTNSNWPSNPDNTNSYIMSDKSAFNKMMIVGHNAGVTGGRRKIGMWDDVDISGNLTSNNLVQSISNIIDINDDNSRNNGVVLDNIKFTFNSQKNPVIRTNTINSVFRYNLQGLHTWGNGYWWPASTANSNNGATLNIRWYQATNNTDTFAGAWTLNPGSGFISTILDVTNKRLYRITCNALYTAGFLGAVDTTSSEVIVTIERLYPIKL